MEDITTFVGTCEELSTGVREYKELGKEVNLKTEGFLDGVDIALCPGLCP